MSLRQSRLSFGPKTPLVASTAKSDSKDVEKTTTVKSTVETDATMEENIESESVSVVKKRNRRVLDSDNEDDELAKVTVGTKEVKEVKEIKEQSSTQEHREEELTMTTKKLKLDPVSPEKPKARSLSSKGQKATNRVEPKDDEAANLVDDDIEADDENQVDEIEQRDEAAEIKQAAAKWADMFSKSSTAEESASWKKGEPVPYAALCQTFEQIEGTTKRLQILDYLVKFLISVIKLSPESLLTVIYLSINKVGNGSSKMNGWPHLEIPGTLVNALV
ncbi:hypothetical protein BGZ65_002140 [Modicella reniformis]|uniref:DNA ligase ATP-dependent N-terminal domain-containing protein n=1 Tax=Modicella reniformis TaxID=1440133 RepID=A0A9P6J1M1_9FUNG|nr:hypothetical protein BGZ65_002140 [Modicella reniformis]